MRFLVYFDSAIYGLKTSFFQGFCMGSTAMREVLANTKKAVKNGVQFFFCNTNRCSEDDVCDQRYKLSQSQRVHFFKLADFDLVFGQLPSSSQCFLRS